eukprot:Colp12_sorted_trinity150504_noHs@15640
MTMDVTVERLPVIPKRSPPSLRRTTLAITPDSVLSLLSEPAQLQRRQKLFKNERKNPTAGVTLEPLSKSVDTPLFQRLNRPHTPSSFRPSTAQVFPYDSIIEKLEDGVLQDWLLRAEKLVKQVQTWWRCRGYFSVDMLQFWLESFESKHWLEWSQMEFGFLLEEIDSAFQEAKRSGSIEESDLFKLVRVVFHEYPDQLRGENGKENFCKMLETLGVGRHHKYRKLLSHVKCRTGSADNGASLLAIRSFFVVHYLSAAVIFYRDLQGLGDDSEAEEAASTEERLFYAAKMGYKSALALMLECNNEVDVNVLDKQGRNLLFVAAVHGHASVVELLLQIGADISVVATSGNSVLHAAASTGDADVLRTLLEAGIEVETRNELCGGATALHVAAMCGHPQAVSVLLKYGANPESTMTGLEGQPATPLSIAQDAEMTDVVAILSELKI